MGSNPQGLIIIKKVGVIFCTPLQEAEKKKLYNRLIIKLKVPAMKIQKIIYILSFISFSLLMTGCKSSSDEPDSNNSQTSLSGELITVAYTSSPFETSITDCQQHLEIGFPDNSDQILCRQGYAVGYNYNKKISNWVSYFITKESVSITRERIDSFSEDQEIPDQYRSALSDYSNSGYDRGHLAPRATMDFTESSMEESFLLSNIAPQSPSLNRGPWADTEQAIRDCAVEHNNLYIVTGTITSNRTIGNQVGVPEYFYKAILKIDSPASAFAVMFSNNETDEGRILSVNALENFAGIDLFSNLQDNVEDKIENNTNSFCSSQVIQPAPAPAPAPTVSCGSKTTCGQMNSCEEAQYYLNSCNVRRLDGDSDGVACESLC